MAIVEISKFTRKNPAKGKYIYYLLARKKLTRYNLNGKLAYDTDELKTYYKNSRIGRPIELGAIEVKKGETK